MAEQAELKNWSAGSAIRTAISFQIIDCLGQERSKCHGQAADDLSFFLDFLKEVDRLGRDLSLKL